LDEASVPPGLLAVKNLDIKILAVKLNSMNAPPDAIDELLAAWRVTRPELDPSPLGLVGRVIVIAQHLQKSVEDALAQHKLTLGQFDILATLRRSEVGLTPTKLLGNVVLSSGGMTSRLDKLEAAAWIVRKPDPDDRRGVIVELTKAGKKLIDAATETRFAEAAKSTPALPVKDREKLESLLRLWLNDLDPE
jgi:DNA-binding MarR family transcriptional regulator